jgi:hypothetical protein
MKTLLICMAISMVIFSCKNETEKTQGIVINDLAMSETRQEEKNKIKEDEISDTTATAQFAPPRIIADKVALDLDRKIVKTADIRLELEKFEDFNKSIRKAIKQYGGYIANEQQQNTDYQLQSIISIKVPVSRFEDMVNSFGGEGIKVLELSISTEDVSDAYVDSKSRMEARKQVRARYIELLKDARKMSDVLSIQNEINSTQEEIEAAAGRMQLLQNQSAYSTINLTYFQYLNGKLPEQPNFFTKVSEAFSNGFHVVGSVVLVFISLWPLVIVGFVIYMIARRYKPAKVKS